MGSKAARHGDGKAGQHCQQVRRREYGSRQRSKRRGRVAPASRRHRKKECGTGELPRCQQAERSRIRRGEHHLLQPVPALLGLQDSAQDVNEQEAQIKQQEQLERGPPPHVAAGGRSRTHPHLGPISHQQGPA
jgi:hypothetical protein